METVRERSVGVAGGVEGGEGGGDGGVGGEEKETSKRHTCISRCSCLHLCLSVSLFPLGFPFICFAAAFLAFALTLASVHLSIPKTVAVADAVNSTSHSHSRWFRVSTQMKVEAVTKSR